VTETFFENSGVVIFFRLLVLVYCSLFFWGSILGLKFSLKRTLKLKQISHRNFIYSLTCLGFLQMLIFFYLFFNYAEWGKNIWNIGGIIVVIYIIFSGLMAILFFAFSDLFLLFVGIFLGNLLRMCYLLSWRKRNRRIE